MTAMLSEPRPTRELHDRTSEVILLYLGNRDCIQTHRPKYLRSFNVVSPVISMIRSRYLVDERLCNLNTVCAAFLCKLMTSVKHPHLCRLELTIMIAVLRVQLYVRIGVSSSTTVLSLLGILLAACLRS